MPAARELRVELGCGKGGFTVGTAEAEPDVLLIAVEKVPDAMVVAMEKGSLIRYIPQASILGARFFFLRIRIFMSSPFHDFLPSYPILRRDTSTFFLRTPCLPRVRPKKCAKSGAYFCENR